MDASPQTPDPLHALETASAGQRVVVDNARWVEQQLRGAGFDVLAARARRNADDAEALLRSLDGRGRF